MRSIRPAPGIAVQAATITATIFSTSVSAAELSPNSAAWPNGDGWIIQLGPRDKTPATHDWEIPGSPLLPDAATPKTVISVPTEFKFNITLTIRHNKSAERTRHSTGTAHCNDVTPQNVQPAHCRGEMGHPRGRR